MHPDYSEIFEGIFSQPQLVPVLEGHQHHNPLTYEICAFHSMASLELLLRRDLHRLPALDSRPHTTLSAVVAYVPLRARDSQPIGTDAITQTADSISVTVADRNQEIITFLVTLDRVGLAMVTSSRSYHLLDEERDCCLCSPGC
ncbi:hypothetical protein DPEC_G00283650 [Dallia pectoralis]|uniref:Uncharacterized protein n=1 Tax=Dallia pectoralis TaxID=75939 RepID=A0ACC2FJ65_DALPE|nr:hypothetical protein DPEC_G00283650 [Dallia pectoralis]